MAVDCGALRPLGDGAAGVERMYVLPRPGGGGCPGSCSPGWRLRRGTTAGRRRGWRPVRGSPEAIALYEGAGYRPVAAFGGYADDTDDSLFSERVLGPA